MIEEAKQEQTNIEKTRCGWVDSSEIYKDYHDNQWGRPVHHDQLLFEMLILEGFQAGLSWITILKKREAFQLAYDNFDPKIVANYKTKKIGELMKNGDIVRHREKINASIHNAKLFLQIQEEFGSFDGFIWAYVDNTPQQNHWATLMDVPSSTPLSEKISKDLKKRGFKFVGATIIYAYMQAIGMVNDHTTDCFCHKECTP